MICAFIVMKCEGFSIITDLVDYLNNNLLIAHYCGFDITRPLPSYWTFDHFLKNFVTKYFPTLLSHKYLFSQTKVLSTLPLLVLTPHLLIPTDFNTFSMRIYFFCNPQLTKLCNFNVADLHVLLLRYDYIFSMTILKSTFSSSKFIFSIRTLCSFKTLLELYCNLCTT